MMYVLNKLDPGLVPVPRMMVPRSRKHYLPFFSMGRPALETLMWSEGVNDNWQGIVGTKESR